MARIIRIDRHDPDQRAIEEAEKIIREGGVVAYPTETFYGLGADGGVPSSVEKIFQIKGRDFNKPIPLIIAGQDHLAEWAASVPETARWLMERFWPGPLTLIFQALPGVSPRLTGGSGKVGIRQSSSAIAACLALRLKGGALTATSANLSGQEECVSAREVVDRLGSLIDVVIDGGTTPGKKGSTIVDVTVHPPVIIREGAIPSSLIFDRPG
jgi:L-threonylcarbamoyladenylate synthase